MIHNLLIFKSILKQQFPLIKFLQTGIPFAQLVTKRKTTDILKNPPGLHENFLKGMIMKRSSEMVSLDFPHKVIVISNGEDTQVKIDLVMSLDKLKSLKGKSIRIKIPEVMPQNDKSAMALNLDNISQIQSIELPEESSNDLTTREKEILDKIATGNSNKDIATALYISLHTVKTHIYNIFKKLNVSSRVQAAMWKTKGV